MVLCEIGALNKQYFNEINKKYHVFSKEFWMLTILEAIFKPGFNCTICKNGQWLNELLI